jgi:hypothetical protein
MIIAPVGSFFIVQYLTGGNAIYSGGTAALIANVVLISYVIAAFVEDNKPDQSEKKNR